VTQSGIQNPGPFAHKYMTQIRDCHLRVFDKLFIYDLFNNSVSNSKLYSCQMAGWLMNWEECVVMA
jgi:hypothetical protein